MKILNFHLLLNPWYLKDYEMKCYASPLDVCHNPHKCKPLNKCAYEDELIIRNLEIITKLPCSECISRVDCLLTRQCLKGNMMEKPMNQPRIPEFIELLEQSKAIHFRKNQDYANESNPFSNFERSAELISWFSNSVDKAFIALIGAKLTRIAELSDGRIPNNESLDDSFLDLVTYCGLWAAYAKRKRNSK